MADNDSCNDENSQPFINSSEDMITSQSLNNNQTTPNSQEVETLQKTLRSSTQFILCPFCHISGMTIIEKECSCSNVVCSIFTTPLSWLIYQVCRRKDLNCYNATHRCQKCGNVLGIYKAC